MNPILEQMSAFGIIPVVVINDVIHGVIPLS